MTQVDGFSSGFNLLARLPFFDVRNLSTDHVSEEESGPATSASSLQEPATETRSGSEATFAQVLPRLQDAATLLDQHAAQKCAAAEVKLLLDAEFARRLQSMQEQDGEHWLDLDSLDVER